MQQIESQYCSIMEVNVFVTSQTSPPCRIVQVEGVLSLNFYFQFPFSLHLSSIKIYKFKASRFLFSKLSPTLFSQKQGKSFRHPQVPQGLLPHYHTTSTQSEHSIVANINHIHIFNSPLTLFFLIIKGQKQISAMNSVATLAA